MHVLISINHKLAIERGEGFMVAKHDNLNQQSLSGWTLRIVSLFYVWFLHCIKSELYLAKWKWILRSGPKLKMLVKFHRSNGSFPNPLNWWWIRFGCTALDQCYWNTENWSANWKSTMHFSAMHILASTMPLIIEFFIKIKSQFGRFWGQTRIIVLSLT